MDIQRKRRLRLILPLFPPFNIYGRIAGSTTSLGPICIGTIANKLPNWDVEIIDENNLRGKDSKFCPKDKNGFPDHKKLQAERPADVVGFYGSMTTAVPRLYELATIYKKLGVTTIAGGYHVRNLPEEALLNNIDIVAMSEGEVVIKNILLSIENNISLSSIKGIALLENGEMKVTEEQSLIQNLDDLPFPDFGLIRYAKIKIFPFSWTRGCNMNCEFCAVKDKARYTSPKRALENIIYLVENFGARRFFDVGDHFTAPGVEQTIKFCKLVENYQKKTGIQINMTVQIRLNDARHKELLGAMRDAGITMVCIGIESCIDEELIAMRKGYREKDIINWINTYKEFGFFIHGMMIFGYPQKHTNQIDISLKEKTKRFKDFIIANLDTAQVLHTVPLPGTELTTRLQTEKRLYDIGYQYYDGQFVLFKPDGDTTPEELQNALSEIMGGFYHIHHLWSLIKAIVINFPVIVFPRVFTLMTFRVKYIKNGFKIWHQKYFRTQSLRFGGNLIVRGWKKNFKNGDFLNQLQQAKKKLTVKETNSQK